jgi:hypothetical protein
VGGRTPRTPGHAVDWFQAKPGEAARARSPCAVAELLLTPVGVPMASAHRTDSGPAIITAARFICCIEA